MSALRLELATPDIVLDEINQMKKEREADRKRLASFIQTKENIDKMVDMEANLKELCARIVPDLGNCTNDDKKDAYTHLDLKVEATTEGADIKGFLDPSVLSTDSCLLTTGQTSECLSSHAYEYLISFASSIKLKSPLPPKYQGHSN